MNKERRQFSTKLKFQVALEAIKETRTINEIANHYSLHPTQVREWKRQLQQEGAEIFSRNGTKEQQNQETLETELYEQIGRGTLWVQNGIGVAEKNLPSSVESKRQMIHRNHPEISVRRQCELVGLNRSSLYYEPAQESEYNLLLMRLIDEQYTKTPFYGWRRMQVILKRQGHDVNHKRAQRGHPGA